MAILPLDQPGILLARERMARSEISRREPANRTPKQNSVAFLRVTKRISKVATDGTADSQI